MELFTEVAQFPAEVFTYFQREPLNLDQVVLTLQARAKFLPGNVLDGLILVALLCSRKTWGRISTMLSHIADRSRLMKQFATNCAASFGVNYIGVFEWIEKHWNM